MMSLVEQGERELGGWASVLVRQRRDHAALQELMRAYETTADAGRRADLVDRLTDRALRHAFAEETVLFPAIRAILPSVGERLTGHIEGEHQQINKLLEDLRRMSPEDERFDPAARRAIELIRDDARNEEDRLLPQLQAAASVLRLRAIGLAWELARLSAPNRPHPEIPRRPWGNVLAGIPLALSDRVRRAGAARVAGLIGLAGAWSLLRRRR